MIDEFLKNEIFLNEISGTYLFYGEDLERNFQIAKNFAKELLIKNLPEKDNLENISTKIDNEVYADLFIEDSLNVDNIREIIKKTYTTSYEGGRKIFIIKNIQNIRKESANALLKVIEEPSENNFFILLSNKLNILPTIKSRSIIYKIKKLSAEDLKVDKYTYEFFMGLSSDIIAFKETNLDLYKEIDFSNISTILKNYYKQKNIENKIEILKCLRNFVSESSSLKTYQKIKFAETLSTSLEKDDIKFIVDYLLNLIKRDRNLKEKLELKKMLRFPINIKLFFINLILEI